MSEYHLPECPRGTPRHEGNEPLGADLRTEVGKALEKVWWIREHLDDDSDEAKAFDRVRAYAQGLDDPA